MRDSSSQAGPLAFGDFLDHLRRQGFTIGVGDVLRLQQALNTISGDCAPSDLKTLLCPILATNKIQQEQFHRTFDSYFNLFQSSFIDRPSRTVEDDLVVRSNESKAELKSATSRKWSYAAWALGFILIIMLAVFIKVVVDKRGIDSPSQNETQKTLNDSTQPGGETGQGQGNKNNNAGHTDTGQTLDSPTGSEVKRTFYQRYKGGIYLGGAIIALLMGVLFYLRRRSTRSRMVLQKQHGEKPPYVWPIRVAGPTARLYDSEQFYAVARLLRHRQVDEFHRLDVEATITATIEAFGYPSFRYKPDSKPPEYLALIDRASFRDHQAQLFNELAKALEQEAIFILRYFYDGDPRICVSETGEHIHLVELQRKYAGHRLLIFGNGEKLIDPITGKLAAWSALFAEWQDRAVLTPITPARWTLREITLASQFVLLPATVDGLLALVSHFESSETNDLGSWRQAYSEAPLPPLDQPGSIEGLRRYLGEDGFQWLCACAVYPELHWDLTLYLGTLPCMEGNLVRQDNLLRLIRLPWFRTGAIPDDLRWLLINELDREKERAVRAAIIEAMEQNPPPQETFAADAYQLDLVVQRWLSLRDRKRRRELLRAMKASPQSQRTRDYTLLRSLESARVSPLDFILPQRLRKLFYQNGYAQRRRRALLGSVVGLALIALVILAAVVISKKSDQPSASPPIDQSQEQAFTVNGVKFEMVEIPGGQFLMGSPADEQDRYTDEGPQHSVTISSFYMGKYEVTQAQWRAVTSLPKMKIDLNLDPSYFKGDNLPVESVSWEEAIEFCARLSQATGETYRLPTEAEWEYACRAGTTTAFAFGDSLSSEQANFDGNYPYGNTPKGKYLQRTVAVGSYQPNAWGLYDMHGNVWEWCQDWYSRDYYAQSPSVDPQGPTTGSARVRRGGGWDGTARSARSAFRSGVAPGDRYFNLGFRLARTYP